MRSVGVCGEVLRRKGAGEGSGLKSRGPFGLVVAVTALEADLGRSENEEDMSLTLQLSIAASPRKTREVTSRSPVTLA